MLTSPEVSPALMHLENQIRPYLAWKSEIKFSFSQQNQKPSQYLVICTEQKCTSIVPNPQYNSKYFIHKEQDLQSLR